METGNYCREDTAFGRVSYVKRKTTERPDLLRQRLLSLDAGKERQRLRNWLYFWFRRLTRVKPVLFSNMTGSDIASKFITVFLENLQ